MKKKLLLFLLIILVSFGTIFAQGQTDAVEEAEPVILKGGLVAPPESSQVATLKRWAEKVEDRTDGQVIIEIYPAEQLGDERQMIEQVNLGTIDWAHIGPSSAQRFTPEFGMFENAYTFQSLNHIKNTVFNPEFLDYFNGILEKNSDLKLMGFQWYGSRHVIADKPILTPEDGEGVLMRTPQVPAYQVAGHAIGVTATPMAYGEVYMGLSQNVIDAAECPLENIVDMKWYEVRDEITLTSHVEGMVVVFMNRTIMDKKLTEEQKEIVNDAALETWQEQFESQQKVEEENMEILEDNGVTFHEPTADQKKVFIERAHEKLAEEYIPEWGEAWEVFQSYAD